MKKRLFLALVFIVGAQASYAQDSLQISQTISYIEQNISCLLEIRLGVNDFEESLEKFYSIEGVERDTTIEYSQVSVYIRHHHHMVGVEIRLFNGADQEVLLYRTIRERKPDPRDNNCLSFDSITREGKTLFFFLETAGKSRDIYSTLLELAKDSGESPESYLEHFILEF